MYNTILTEQKGHVLLITINRPSQLNALNKETIEELHRALASGDEDSGTGAIILTGSGDKSFVAGADIKEFADFSIAQWVCTRRWFGIGNGIAYSCRFCKCTHGAS